MRLPKNRSRLAPVLSAACFLGAGGLSGCSDLGVGSLTKAIPAYVVAAEKPSNVIERALAQCKEKTEAEETKCVKAGLADAKISLNALTAMIPNCRLGRLCQYRYTTNDRLGYLDATAADFIVHWQVDFDLRPAGVSISTVPIKVVVIGT